MLAKYLKNSSFWPQSHFFTITTPKPVYIYPNTFSKENFSKKNFGPLGPHLGYPGSLSWDPLHRIFSKCGFLNLLSPLGLPIPSNGLGSSKKLKNFPKGCVQLCNYLLSTVLIRNRREREILLVTISGATLKHHLVRRALRASGQP